MNRHLAEAGLVVGLTVAGCTPATVTPRPPDGDLPPSMSTTMTPVILQGSGTRSPEVREVQIDWEVMARNTAEIFCKTAPCTTFTADELSAQVRVISNEEMRIHLEKESNKAVTPAIAMEYFGLTTNEEVLINRDSFAFITEELRTYHPQKPEPNVLAQSLLLHEFVHAGVRGHQETIDPPAVIPTDQLPITIASMRELTLHGTFPDDRLIQFDGHKEAIIERLARIIAEKGGVSFASLNAPFDQGAILVEGLNKRADDLSDDDFLDLVFGNNVVEVFRRWGSTPGSSGNDVVAERNLGLSSGLWIGHGVREVMPWEIVIQRLNSMTLENPN